MNFIRNFVLLVINIFPKRFKWFFYSIPFIKNKLRIDFGRTRQKLFSKPVKIIVVGANDGLSFDNLFPGVDPEMVSGIVVEPSKKYFSQLKINLRTFKGLDFLNCAIADSQENFSLYQLNEQGLAKLPDWGRGLGSFSKDNLLKFPEISEDDIEEEKVRGVTFNYLIEQHSLTFVDYFQIDTEGFDGKIIKMIDFNSFKTKLFKFEWVNLSPSELIECNEKLTINGYYIVKEGNDVVGYSLDIDPIFY